MISVQFTVLFGRRISENHYHHRLTFSQLVGKEFPDLKVENFLISEYHDLIGENCPMFTEINQMFISSVRLSSGF